MARSIIIALALAILAGCASAPLTETTKALDVAAVEALKSQEIGVPYEVVTEIVGQDKFSAMPFIRLGMTGGAYKVRDAVNVAAIVHTHPFFSVRVSATLGIDAVSANRKNQYPGPHDADLVTRWGIPNYYRTPMGDAIGVIEPNGNKASYRLVWTRAGGYRH